MFRFILCVCKYPRCAWRVAPAHKIVGCESSGKKVPPLQFSDTHITCLSLTFLCVFHLALHTFRLLLSSSVIPPSQLTPSNDLLANYFEVLPAVSRLTLPLFPAPRQSLAAVQKLPNSFPKQTFSMCVCPHAGVCVCMLAASVANQFKSFSVAVA